MISALLSASVALLTLTGCGTKELQTDKAATPDPQSRVGPGDTIEVKGTVDFIEPTEFHEGVGIKAIAQGNSVSIYIRNARETDFLLSPTDFAVIVDRQQHRVESGRTDFRRFPYPFRMPPEAVTAGVITFPRLGDLAGARLVFNNPEIGKPFFVPIEGAETKGP